MNPEESKPEAEGAEGTPAEAPVPDQQKESDIGDFITRHVLEKDSVFFEG